MKKNINPSLLFPILFLSIHLLIILFGNITKSIPIAIFKGSVGSLAWDPLIMVLSLISALIYKDFKKSIICILSTAFVVCFLANLLIPRAGIAVFLFRFNAMLLWSSLGMLARTVFELARKKLRDKK